ncbi:type II toxin-antitoxin system PemK/MazF family toxin [Longispora urticae]
MSNLYPGAAAVICLLLVGLAAILIVNMNQRRRQPSAPPHWTGEVHNTPDLHDRPPGPAWLEGPQPGEIWWADVPFADGEGSEQRPCLVLRTHKDRADVLKITSQDQGRGPRYVALPPGDWDSGAGQDSWLDLSGFFRVHNAAFAHQTGVCDEKTWWQVRRYHETGWVP